MRKMMAGLGKGAELSLLPVGALLLAMMSFTLGASFAKHLFPLVGAQGATTLRLVLGALILAVVLRPWRTRLATIAWPIVLVYGLAMAGMNLLFYMALKTLPLGIAISLEFTGPLTVALISSRRGVDFLWIACAIVGLLLLLPLTKEAPHLDLAGVALALGAGVCWALYIVAGKRAGLEHGAVTTSFGMSIGAIAVLPIGLAHAGAALFHPSILVAGLVVALLSSALPYALEMVALRHLPAQTYGTLTSCEPAVGAMVGLFLLGETLALIQCVAIGLVIVASVGVTMTAMRARLNASAPLVIG
jgi:inner membrane transporter RhtA